MRGKMKYITRILCCVFTLHLVLSQLTDTTPVPTCNQIEATESSFSVLVIGLFSMMSKYGKDVFNAAAFHEHLAIVDASNTRHISSSSTYVPFGYVSFDVCENKELLAEVIVTLMLDGKYLFKESQPTDHSRSCNCIEQSERVVAIVGHMSDDMIRLAANLLLSSRIIFFAMKDKSIFPDVETSHLDFIPFASLTDHGWHLQKFVNHFKWQNLLLICMSCHDEDERRKFHHLWAHLQGDDHQLCLSSQEITQANNVTILDDLVRKLKSSEDTEIAIVYGQTRDLMLFAKAVSAQNLTDKVWIITEDISRSFLYKYSIPENFRFGMFTVQNPQVTFLLPLVKIFERPYVLQDSWVKKYMEIVMSQSNSTMFVVPPAIDKHYRQVRKVLSTLQTYVTSKDVNFAGVNSAVKLRLKKRSIQFKNYQANLTSIQFPVSDIPNTLTWPSGLRESPDASCMKRLCPPGWENKFSDVLKNETIWQKSYGWTCRMCKENHVKGSFGTSDCVVCQGFLVANSERTLCYDPYKIIQIQVSSLGSMICLILASVGTAWNLLTLAVSYKHRKTPCVRSGDLFLTFSQLISFIIFFPAFTFVTLMKPSTYFCAAQPCIAGLVVTFSIAITLSKVQKIILVFRAKKKVSRKSVVLAQVTQFFVVSVLVLIASIMLLTFFMENPPGVARSRNDSTLEQYFYCNTDVTLHAQVLFALVLSLVCNVQGFRSRNLPRNFNETKFILFASLTFSLCLIIMFPLYYSQQNPITKSTVSLLLLLLGTLLLSVILYFSKMYVVLFRPELNTTAVFRKNLMEKMQKNVEKETVKREKKLKLLVMRDV